MPIFKTPVTNSVRKNNNYLKIRLSGRKKKGALSGLSWPKLGPNFMTLGLLVALENDKVYPGFLTLDHLGTPLKNQNFENQASSCFKLAQIRPRAKISLPWVFWWLQKTDIDMY